MAENVPKNPGIVLETGTNFGTEFASRSSKSALLTLINVIKFYHTSNGSYLGKLF